MTGIRESVKRDIVVNASIENIWDALTKPERLNDWYTKDAKIDFRVGGHAEMNHGWGALTSGTFTEIEEYKKYVLESGDGYFKTITTLKEEEDGVRVSIEYQTPFIGEEGEAAKENMAYGTFQFLENLKSVYENNQDNRPTMWKSWIGIIHTTNNPSDSSEHENGTKVIHVADPSPALEAGVKAKDVITAIDGDAIQGYESLERTLNKKDVGQSITLTITRTVRRKKEQISLDCKVRQYPVEY